MYLTPVSSMWRPSPPILIRVSVSGTCAIHTTEFKVLPPIKRPDDREKARGSQTRLRISQRSLKARESFNGGRDAIHEPATRGRCEPGGRSPHVPVADDRLQTPDPRQRKRQSKQRENGTARRDECREFLLREADELPDADGHRDDRRRRDPRLDRVVRQVLPESEPRRRTESADPEALHQVPVQTGRGVGARGLLTWP